MKKREIEGGATGVDAGASIGERIENAVFYGVSHPEMYDLPSSAGDGCGCTDGESHSVSCRYEHFLSYSGLSDESMLRYAYFHGANVGIEQPHSSQSNGSDCVAEPVAWRVTGSYTDVPFRDKRSAEAYCGGLLDTDPDGGYTVSPAYAQPAAPVAEPVAIWDAESDVARPLGHTRIPEGTELYMTAPPHDAELVELLREALPALQHLSDTAQTLEGFTLCERVRAKLASLHQGGGHG